MCTRVIFSDDGKTVITGRSMDWNDDMHSNLYVFPRGITRAAGGQKDPLTWTSKYGSVVVSAYEIASADGMNEKGLVGNLLYLAESDYGQANGKPILPISMWVQYVLDNFASVAEAVDALQSEPFRIGIIKIPNGRAASLHLCISDSTGDSAIFEYVGGKLTIHHGKEYKVMTNSPIYDQQLALRTYWQHIGGMTFMPGTISAADRFVRTSFFVDAAPKKVDDRYITAVPNKSFNNQALASTLGILRAIGVPLGIASETEPNISSSLWRTLSDHNNRVYYFDSATTPSVFWVDFKNVNFDKGQPIKKLKVQDGMIYAGDTAQQFTDSTGFEFASSN
jgi:choloylglycine hydrolase